MSDLISRDALIDVIDNMVWYHVNSKGELVPGATSATGLYRFEDIMGALGNAPAIEAKSVVHAHWIPVEGGGFRDMVLTISECSNCGGQVSHHGYACPDKYCKHCGAHMDEEVADV